MANRYWVGGTGTWNTTSTTNWSASSGGASGASVPTAADSVFFDQAGTYTVTCTGALTCNDITVSAGTVTFATGTSPTFAVSGSMSLRTGTVWNATGTITFNATTTGKTITTNGTSLSGAVTLNGVGGEWTLGSALTLTGVFTVTNGNFLTGNYNLTSSNSFSATGSAIRSISFGSSTVSVTSMSLGTGITFNAGTSQINLSQTTGSLPSGFTFYNVTFTSPPNTTGASFSLGSNNTFNNLTIAARTTTGTGGFSIGDTTINGTLTLSAGSSVICRSFITGISQPSTISVASFAAGSANWDFQDIAITGAAAPISGTRFGDGTGNSGITFPAAKTVYWNLTGTQNWSATAWATSSGGTPSLNNFPLAHDTAIFNNSGSATTVTFDFGWWLKTLTMSSRTTAVTINFGSLYPRIYGDLSFGSGVTVGSGLGTLFFEGSNSSTITSAGKNLSNDIRINKVNGSITLQDAINTNGSTLNITAGTFNTGNYSVTTGYFQSAGTLTRTLNTGSSTITVTQSGTTANNEPCRFSSTGLTFTSTGTISMTASATKAFAGGSFQNFPTINQGGSGELRFTSSGKFANITNTYSATGATTVTFASGAVFEFVDFNLTGTVGKVCTLKALSTTQAILKKPSTWYMGANSTDGGNNTGLIFTAGGGIDYLNVSYINGQIVSPSTASGKFLNFFPM